MRLPVLFSLLLSLTIAYAACTNSKSACLYSVSLARSDFVASAPYVSTYAKSISVPSQAILSTAAVNSSSFSVSSSVSSSISGSFFVSFFVSFLTSIDLLF
jgi:hypothetical protein